MAYTARELIAKSYYLSGIVAKGLQTVYGDQLTDGLDLLNGLLAVKAIDTELIPYYQQYNLVAVIGQEKYFIPFLLEAETFTFNIGSVRYSMLPCKRKRYFGSGRVDTIQALPFNWHLERTLGGSDLYLYFLPDANYPLIIWGKFGLDSVPDENFDLSTIYDRYYIEYLRYALAEYICAEYNIEFQQQSMQKLRDLEYMLVEVSAKDLSIQKLSTLQATTGLNWADVNIGHSWRPA